jgi:Domain of unknown function (DU1801)
MDMQFPLFAAAPASIRPGRLSDMLKGQISFGRGWRMENKTKPNRLSVNGFIDAIGDAGKRADARSLLRLLQSATGEAPRMWGSSIVGFGNYHYVYESGREGDAPLIGFSPRKTATVLYLHLGLQDAAAELAKLGRHTTGKGCLYIKKLADVDQKVLERIVARSVAGMREKHRSK